MLGVWAIGVFLAFAPSPEIATAPSVKHALASRTAGFPFLARTTEFSVGARISDPEGRISDPEGRISNPEGRISNPEGRISNPEGRISNPEGRISDVLEAFEIGSNAASSRELKSGSARTLKSTSSREAGSEATREPSRVRNYLTRELAYGARYLDHGVLQVSAAGGWPHLYALRMSLGVLDHITIGAQAHWVPRSNAPRAGFKISPEISIAILRLRWLEFGGYYRQTLYPAARADDKAKTPSFAQVDHWFLSSLSFSNKWLTGGFDFGLVRARIKDPGQDPPGPNLNPSTIRWKLGGGLHLRAGTRRWGLTASVLAPQLMAELAIDVRFGLFEMRPKGGWRPAGIVYSSDRRVPTWR